MESIIRKQIEDARHRIPGLDGIIHGIRKIRQGKHGSRASLFYSKKSQALIPVESGLERDFCYQLEADPQVAFYRTQALAIPYRKATLHPDFLIFDHQGSAYIREVKHSVFTDSERTTQKTNYLMALFAQYDLEYAVVTEEDMLRPIEKSNWAMLYDRGGRLGISINLLEWIIALVSKLAHKSSTLSALRLAIHESELPAYLLEATLFSGGLRCRMDRPINSQTLIEVTR